MSVCALAQKRAAAPCLLRKAEFVRHRTPSLAWLGQKVSVQSPGSSERPSLLARLSSSVPPPVDPVRRARRCNRHTAATAAGSALRLCETLRIKRRPLSRLSNATTDPAASDDG